ncbi:MAG: type II toxin-antitoxin system PemK/MazF family toxin [Polyangiaceae bacterium]|nr:type II toxin-antitoxin system PemK/MazF family toxin [Polyangiaceae bacterium]
MRRGEIRWYVFGQPDKRRPVLVLTRDEVVDTLNEIIVAPATRTTRGLKTEVPLTVDDGMPLACVLTFDHVALAQRARIGALITTLDPSRWPEVESALLIACGFEPRSPRG